MLPSRGDSLLSEGNNTPPSEQTELSIAKSATKSNLAFVVNIPIKLEINDQGQPDFEKMLKLIKEIEQAYLINYEQGKSPPFKIAFCVNSPLDQSKALANFKCHWEAFTADHQNKEAFESVSLVYYLWKEKSFPYGAVRNALLHSNETQKMIKDFQNGGFYPYVAVGDADTGARVAFIDNEAKNIFDAIDMRLNIYLHTPSQEKSEVKAEEHSINDSNNMNISLQKSEMSEDRGRSDSNSLYIRPYLIAGGYRPIDNDKAQSKSLSDDMSVRSKLSKTVNPLGPYFPEPNLFIDASVASRINFGDKGNEFLNLREEIARIVLEDFNKLKPSDISLAEWKESTAVNIKNNRHPERERLIAAFFDLTIQTDTQRLFKNIKVQGDAINYNSVAQHHQQSNLAKRAFLENRYDPQRNAKSVFVDVRNFLNQHKGNMNKFMEIYHELIYCQKAASIGYVGNALDKSYLENRTKDQDILNLAKGLVAEAIRVNSLDSKGHSNRSAEPFVTAEYTALDIFNTAVATVYMKETDNLLQEYWQNEVRCLSQSDEKPSIKLSEQKEDKLDQSSLSGVAQFTTKSRNTLSQDKASSWEVVKSLAFKDPGGVSDNPNKFMYALNKK